MLSSFSGLLAWSDLAGAVAANSKLSNRCTVVMSMGPRKRFMLMRDKYSIGNINPNLCLCEVVLEDTARPFIDFDEDVESSIDIISQMLIHYFSDSYGASVSVGWKWSELATKRWHCIISGVYFNGCWREGCNIMSNVLSRCLKDINIDDSVYRHNSCLRMIYQNKYVDGKYIKKLMPYRCNDLGSLFICCDDGDMSISYKQRIPYNAALGGFSVKKSQEILPGGFTVPIGLKISSSAKVYDSCIVVRLSRCSPSLCILCKRIHTSDNAYIILKSNVVEYRCFRKPKDNNGEEIIATYSLQQVL